MVSLPPLTAVQFNQKGFFYFEILKLFFLVLESQKEAVANDQQIDASCNICQKVRRVRKYLLQLIYSKTAKHTKISTATHLLENCKSYYPSTHSTYSTHLLIQHIQPIYSFNIFNPSTHSTYSTHLTNGIVLFFSRRLGISLEI